MSSFSSPTDVSCKSSERFRLNEKDKRSILVYKRPKGLMWSSEQDLCKILDSDRTLGCSRVRIPWGNSRVEVRQQDLLSDRDRKRFAELPTMRLSLASINLPRPMYWKRMFGVGNSRDLYIVSSESSPKSSPESSQHISPNSTFPPEEQATEGAASK